MRIHQRKNAQNNPETAKQALRVSPKLGSQVRRMENTLDSPQTSPTQQLNSDRQGFNFGEIPIFAGTPTTAAPAVQAKPVFGAAPEKLGSQVASQADPAQMKAEPFQRQDEEEYRAQAKGEADQQIQAIQPQINLAPSGSGEPMPEPVQQKMEGAFGADFSGVRIHEGPQAKAINAVAYTQGENIHFQPGKYQPDTQSGQELLGHELTHVVQQKAGRVAVPQGKGVPINADPGLETEADILGAKAARGDSVEVSGVTSRTEPPTQVLQCDTENDSTEDYLAMEKEDWEYKPELFDKKENREDQFKSDTALWYHTIMDKPSSNAPQNAKQQEILEQQQAILKRNFLAMGYLGVEAGNQETGEYEALENQNDVPLAALASHGGRYAYEFNEATQGKAFKNWFFAGDTKKNYNEGKGAPESNILGRNKALTTNAGLYDRVGTHGQEYNPTTGQWKETKKKFYEKIQTPEGSTKRKVSMPTDIAVGMNIPMGGIGNQVKNTTTRKLETIGYQGWTDKGHQLGSAFFKYNKAKKKDAPWLGAKDEHKAARLMVGFEGTAYGQSNPLGAGHGTDGKANAVSLTGQSKATDTNILPNGMGSLKSSDITEDKITRLVEIENKLEKIRELRPDYYQEFYRSLLQSQTKKERNRLFEWLDTYDQYLKDIKNKLEKIKEVRPEYYEKFYQLLPQKKTEEERNKLFKWVDTYYQGLIDNRWT